MIPEIFSPAGNMTCLQAALGAGADAVYLGVDVFNMRCGASANFSREALPEASRRCREAGVRLYLTVNTIVFEDELPKVEELLAFAKPHIDAAIVSDWAVFRACKRLGIPIHVSTQMSCSNSAAASFLKEMGAARVVLARECTLDEVSEITRKCGIEIETFVHGAICVAESGRCFLSHEAYGFSANRGECRQPCRRFYRVEEIREDAHSTATFDVAGHTIFSARDLFSLPFLDRLVAAGVASFKIEGRGRNAEYVATVTKAYRTARDAVLAGTFTPELVRELTEACTRVYHRDLGTGLYFGRPGKEQFVADGTENLATIRKMHLGVVTEYYLRTRTVLMKVHNDALHPGDRLSIQGDKTGVVELSPAEVFINGRSVSKARKGADATFACEAPVQPGDIVYQLNKV